MTSTTRPMLMAIVNCTSLIDARIVWVRSPRTRTTIEGGRVRLSPGSASFTNWTV